MFRVGFGGLGFTVYGLRFRVWGRVWELRIWGSVLQTKPEELIASMILQGSCQDPPMAL